MSELTPTRSKEYSIVFLSACVISMMTGTVATAYGMQLGTGSIHARGLSDGFMVPVPLNSLQQIEKQNVFQVPMQKSFFSQLATAMHSKPQRILWSSYPASIRGQAFSGITTRDASPLEVAAGSGW